MKKIPFFIFLFCNMILLSIETDAKDIRTVNNKKIDTTKQLILDNSNKNADSLYVTADVFQKNSEKTFFEYVFPSILAIVVAIIALIGSLITMKRQIISSQIIIDKQIESANKASELAFRQSVLSSNRKDWIEELRQKISHLTAMLLLMSVIETKNTKDFEEVIELITHLQLMLNPNDPRDIELSELLDIAIGLTLMPEKYPELKIGDTRKSIIKCTKSILKSEWERVKKGE